VICLTVHKHWERLSRCLVAAERERRLSQASDFPGDLGALNQRGKARLLDGRDMDEDVLAASIGLNEAVALLPVEPSLFQLARRSSISLSQSTRTLERRNNKPASNKNSPKSLGAKGWQGFCDCPPRQS